MNHIAFKGNNKKNPLTILLMKNKYKQIFYL